MASAVVDDWEQLADPEPEWDSDDFVPPPVGNASVTPAPVATPIAAAASAPEELVYSTVLDEDDMATLETFGDRAAFTPRDIRQYIADHYNPRGGGRNHKYVRVEDPNTLRHRPVTYKNFKNSEVFDECRELLLSHPLYRRLSREGQKKMLLRFVKFCEHGRERNNAGIDGPKHAYHTCEYHLAEFMPQYSQRGSIL